jgi:exodeoxyribonuclease VII small subunit
MEKKSKTNLSTFEKDLKAMQDLLNDIESKDLSLEDVIQKYKQGIELSKKCQKALEEAEQKIKEVSSISEK